jgi:hypothetical protein
MDFTKFVSMLENRGLFFSRLDLLGDPFEGSRTRADEENAREHYGKTVVAAAAYHTETFSRKRVMVNCWHMSEHESAAMWKIYAAGGKTLAIQSTFDKVRGAVAGAVVGVGLVEYVDHITGRMNERHPFYSTFMQKQDWFEYEKEVRALVYNRDNEIPERGVFVSVDLASVLESIYAAPESGTLSELVQGVVARYGLNIPVRRSSLDDRPSY